MKKTRIWSLEESAIIESNYKNNVLFKAIKDCALEWTSKSQAFSLSPSELFYHVIYNLDNIRCKKDKGERLNYCSRLWNEMYEYITNNVNIDIDNYKEDINNATNLVVVTTAICLNEASSFYYIEEIEALFKTNIKRHSNNDINNIINDVSIINNQNNIYINSWIKEYINSSDFISDDIRNNICEQRTKLKMERRSIEANNNNIITNYYESGSIHNDNRKSITINSNSNEVITKNTNLIDRNL